METPVTVKKRKAGFTKEFVESVRLSPVSLNNEARAGYPESLQIFVPNDCFLGGLEGSDWKRLLRADGVESQYHPIRSAPTNNAEGGTIYFDNGITRADLAALLRILEPDPFVPEDRKKYAAYLLDAQKPGEEGYIQQLRIVSNFGLRFLFHSITEEEDENFPKQKVTPEEAIWLFIQKERERWGTGFWDGERTGLAGMFGGDGNMEREKLSFGLMLENSYFSIYRIWSRAWLVNK